MRWITAVSLTAAQSSVFHLRPSLAKRTGEDNEIDGGAISFHTTAAEPNNHALVQRFSSSSRRRKIRQTLSLLTTTVDNNTHHLAGQKLVNRASADSRPTSQHECDPLHPTDVPHLEADTGVLSCGSHEYCIESSSSSLGGYCVPEEVPSSNQRTVPMTSRRSSTYNAMRHLQDGPLTITGLQEFFCHSDSHCTCTSVDDQSVTVTCLEDAPGCYTYVNKCETPMYGCVTYNYIVELTATHAVRKRIYEQSAPYYERIVYTGIAAAVDGSNTEVASCQVEFDGVQCASCQVVPRRIGDLDGTTTAVVEWPCYQFDCTNTVGGHSGNMCDLDATKVFDYVSYEGCPVCNICEHQGLGAVMTLFDVTVPFPDQSYGCEELGRMASQGLLSSVECDVVQAYAAEACGCTMP
jgi:hypothetical protein